MIVGSVEGSKHLDSDDQCSGISSLEDIDEGVGYMMEPVPHIITIA